VLTHSFKRAHPFNAAMKKIRYGEGSGSRQSKRWTVCVNRNGRVQSNTHAVLQLY